MNQNSFVAGSFQEHVTPFNLFEVVSSAVIRMLSVLIAYPSPTRGGSILLLYDDPVPTAVYSVSGHFPCHQNPRP